MDTATILQLVTDGYQAEPHENCPGCRRLKTEALALRKALDSLGVIADAIRSFDREVRP